MHHARQRRVVRGGGGGQERRDREWPVGEFVGMLVVVLGRRYDAAFAIEGCILLQGIG